MTKKATREKKELRIDTHSLWSRLIFKLFRGTCGWCGRENVPMHSHHIKAKSQATSNFMKYHPLNGLLCCAWAKADGEKSCHQQCDDNRDEVMRWLKQNLPLHYKFLTADIEVPKQSMSEVNRQLTLIHEAYDLNPTPQIIPRCHLPPNLFKEMVKRESGIIIPDKTIKSTGDIIVP